VADIAVGKTWSAYEASKCIQEVTKYVEEEM